MIDRFISFDNGRQQIGDIHPIDSSPATAAIALLPVYITDSGNSARGTQCQIIHRFTERRYAISIILDDSSMMDSLYHQRRRGRSEASFVMGKTCASGIQYLLIIVLVKYIPRLFITPRQKFSTHRKSKSRHFHFHRPKQRRRDSIASALVVASLSNIFSEK